jgi:hypothetical protein
MHRIASLLLTCCLLATASPSAAATIGYWRMEVDDDPDPDALSVANEVAGGSPLISLTAELDGSNLPVGVVPLSTEPNAFALASRFQGGAAGIDASAAWYDALAVTSVTVEYWARTGESTATPFRWTTGGADGIVITDPNSLDVTWYVDVAGAATAFTMTGLDDMDTAWSHYAFAYDEVTGVATFYVDGVVVDSFDGPDGAPLVVIAGTPIELGVLMDFASAGQGTIDEVRISGAALGAPALLTPEPSAGLLTAVGVLVLSRRGRRSARH